MIWDRLYKLANDFLYVYREADIGWNYALYSRDGPSRAYSLADGGYIQGETTANIDDIASLAAYRLKADDTPIPANLSFETFAVQIDTKPDITIRGVRIFLSPELKKAGINALPNHILTDLRRIIDRRLSSPILLMHNLMGWKMHFISNDNLPDTTPVSVELPDAIGHLYPDTNVSPDDIGEYDTSWAYRLWMEPIYIDRRGNDIVIDSD